jgi:enoyl-CoA hydratase
LAYLFTKLASDPETRYVLLTGNAKTLAAGADIAEMVEAGEIEMIHHGIHRLLKSIETFPKPLFAAVNGLALGGGCELAMHADIIIASESASFGFPEVKLAIMLSGGDTQRLTREVGKFKAMRMLLTGDLLPARDAYAMNLVIEIVEDDAVEAHAVALAEQIAGLSSLAVSQIKEVVLAAQNASLESALALERKGLQLLFASLDQKEGMRVFLEKRTPSFLGR